jgi:NAD(P)-dependent dehydrogenase (short-subunit alcohol dehydrogenase family)
MATRSIIVTGSGSGIGRASAIRLAAAGASVVCTDLEPPTATADHIRAEGGSAFAMALDVGSWSAWTASVEAAMERFGPVFALANVAGHGTGGVDTAVGTSEEAWDRVMRTNLRGAWYGMRAVIPAMIEHGGGRIVNVSSAAALTGVRNTFAYAASKGGIIAMTRQAAVEYGRQGVRCNAIAPGATLTPALQALPKEWFDSLAARNALNHIADPSEIAAMVAFLCSDEASYVSGAVLPVDGGTSAYGEA